MRLSSLILFTLLGGLYGCQDTGERTLLSGWKSPQKTFEFERKVASLPKNQCVKDLYSVDELAKSVATYESLYESAPKVSGRWKHLDLSQLPVPQATFLLKYGAVIGDRADPEAIDYSDCQDVPCILNKIYGKQEHQNGFVHYLWFLKFGHLLAADNMIPRQSSPNPGEYQGKTFSLSQYLFSDNEIFGFWRLFLTLDPSFANILTLKEIQRIPSGTWMENNLPKNCGNAGTDGYIVLMDGCLRGPETEMGDFYYKVTHEMSHHIDFSSGRQRVPPTPYLSRTQEYLDLAGIRRIEYQDELNRTVIKFEPKEGAKFVSEYSKESPVETFAESMAYYRFSGERTRATLSPEHFDFLREKFYEGRSYTNAGYFERWEEKYSSFVNENTLKLVSECLKVTETVSGTDYLTDTEIPPGPNPAQSSCLSKRTQEVADAAFGRIMSHEPEGCVLMNWESNRSGLKRTIRTMIVAYLKQIFTGINDSPDFLAKIQDLFSEKDHQEVRQIFLRCSGNESCFERQMDAYASVRADELRFSSSDIVRKLFLAYYPVSKVSEEVAQFYRILLESHSGPINVRSVELWGSCKSGPADDTVPVSSLNSFTIREGYMVSSLYRCLNEGVERVVEGILGEIRYQGIPLRDQQERAYMRPLVKAQIRLELDNLYTEARREENLALQRFITENGQEESQRIRQKLLDFNWVEVGEVRSRCQTGAIKEIQFPLYFALKKDAFRPIVDKVSCHTLTSSPEFRQWSEKNRPRLTDSVYAHAERRMLEKGRELISSCADEACLEESWSTLEEEISLSESKLDVAYRLQISKDAILQFLKKNRDQWMKRLKES